MLARSAAAASSASTPTPRRTSTRACATCAENLRFERGARRDASRSRADAVVFLQTIEHLHDPGAVLAHFRSLVGPARRRLRLDAERADARAEGREPLGQPLARARVPRAASSRELCRSSFAHVRAVRPLPRPQAARARARAAPAAGTACTRALGLTERFYERFTPAICDARLRAARGGGGGPRPGARLPRRLPRRERRAAPRERGASSRSSCTRTCPTSRASAPGRSARSGCGRRSSAATCRCSTLLDAGAPLTLSLTPVLCDQLEAAGRRAALRALRARGARRDPRARRGGPAGARPRAAGARARARVRRTTSGRSSACRSVRRRPARGARRRTPSGPPSATHAILPLLATDAGVRAQVRSGIASHRRRFGGWRGGFWLPECAYAPWLEDGRCTRRACARVCVELTSALGARRLGAPAAARDRVAAWCSCRSTARRSRSCGASEGYPARGRLPRLPPPHDPPPQPLEQRRRRLRARGRAAPAPAPTRPTSWRAYPRAPARGRRARRAGQLPGRRPGRVRARHRAARALVVRGGRVARGRASRSARRAGPRAGAASTRRSRAAPLSAAGARRTPAGGRRGGAHGVAPQQLGRAAATSRRGRRRRVAELAFAARAAELEVLRAGRGRERGGACASCSRCRPATGPS